MDTPFALIDCPVYALTARSGDEEDAMIATWILDASLADDRGRLIAVLTPEHYCLELIDRSRRFLVQVLAVGQHALIERFGLHCGRVTNKLAGLGVLRTESGIAIVPGTCGWAECEVLERTEAIDRVILACAIRGTSVKSDKQALTLSAAYRVLPRTIVDACEAQRARHGARDRDV